MEQQQNQTDTQPPQTQGSGQNKLLFILTGVIFGLIVIKAIKTPTINQNHAKIASLNPFAPPPRKISRPTTSVSHESWEGIKNPTVFTDQKITQEAWEQTKRSHPNLPDQISNETWNQPTQNTSKAFQLNTEIWPPSNKGKSTIKDLQNPTLQENWNTIQRPTIYPIPPEHWNPSTKDKNSIELPQHKWSPTSFISTSISLPSNDKWTPTKPIQILIPDNNKWTPAQETTPEQDLTKI